MPRAAAILKSRARAIRAAAAVINRQQCEPRQGAPREPAEGIERRLQLLDARGASALGIPPGPLPRGERDHDQAYHEEPGRHPMAIMVDQHHRHQQAHERGVKGEEPDQRPMRIPDDRGRSSDVENWAARKIRSAGE